MINLKNISFIEDSEGKKAVVLPIGIYDKIQERLEELNDIDSYIKVKNQAQESFPLDLVEQLVLSSESKIKTLREYRKYTLTSLSKKVGVSEAYMCQVEKKKRKGTVEFFKNIADALDVDIELLI